MMDFLDIFREEVETNLKEATRLTLALENGEPAREQTEALMRVFHTLKGAARAMQFEEEKRSAHLLEDVYHDLLDGKTDFRPELSDLSLEAIDLIRSQVAARLEGTSLPDSSDLAERTARYRAGEPLGPPSPKAGEGEGTEPVSSQQQSGPKSGEQAPAADPSWSAEAAAASAAEDPGSRQAPGRQGPAAEANDDMGRESDADADAGADPGPDLGDDADADQDADEDVGTSEVTGRGAALPASGEGARAPSRPGRGGGGSSRRRASVAYEQLDRLHRLSGELTVSVGAMAGQRGRVRRLARELEQAMRQISRVRAGQVESLVEGDGARAGTGAASQDALEGLHELLQPVMERLEAISRGIEGLSQAHDRTEGQLQQLAEHLVDEVTQARLVPLSELLDDYPRMVRDLARDLGKQVELRIEGEANRIDRAVLEALRNPLLHLVRNALDHGIEAPAERLAAGKEASGRLAIEAQQLGSMMRVRVADDGNGIDLERLRETVVSSGRTTAALWQAMGLEEQMQFLFLPGLSTAGAVSETSGRGFGLDIVKTGLDAMGAHIGVFSERGNGSCFELQVPLSLALTRCLLVCGGQHRLFGDQHYAFPMHEVLSVSRLDPAQLRRVDGRPAVHLDGETLPLYELSQLFGLAPLADAQTDKHLLVLGDAERHGAVLVERVLDELDVVTRPLDERLGKVQEVSGLTLLDDGGLALVVDTPDLLQRLGEGVVQQLAAPLAAPEPAKHILVVEDSVTVREVERHFLTQAGYAVTTAVNGVDGLNKAKAGEHDMVVTDIDMPRMNGIELIRTLRGMERFRRLPVIVVSYKDRSEDRDAALAAGANRYVTKAEFDTDAMLTTVAELLATMGKADTGSAAGSEFDA
jgi:two-component system sensor histidine kinase and response regulator WspE